MGGSITSEAWNACFATFCSVCLRPPIGTPYLPFPVSHPVLACLPPAPGRPQFISADSTFLELVLDSENQRAVPLSFFHLFFHLAVDPTPGRMIRVAFAPKSLFGWAFVRTALPAWYFAGRDLVFTEKVKAHFSDRPPSFTVAFFRSLSGVFALPLPKALVADILRVLTPVFPEFGFVNCPIWESAWPETRLMRGWLCHNAESVIARPDRWAIGVYHALMQNPKFSEHDAATRALLQVAVGELVSVSFASRACSAVLAYATDIVGIISTPEFLNSARFINVLVIGVRVAKHFAMAALLEALAPHIADERARAVFGSGDMAAAALALG
jgi:hypothetical protein